MATGNSRTTTLTTLLSIKVRRARSIRAALARLGRQESVLLEKKDRLMQQRQQLLVRWRHCGVAQQVLDHSAWQVLKAELAGYYQLDQHILSLVDALQAEWVQLQTDRAEQQRLLRQALVKQEKFKTLME